MVSVVAEQKFYMVSEDVGNASVCAVIVDAIQREVVVMYMTPPDSTPGVHVRVCV